MGKEKKLAKISIYFVTICLLISGSPVFMRGEELVGPGAVEFLNLNLNARPAGLGGAFVAVADDVNSLYYNPAGLPTLNNSQITFMHNQWFQNILQEYVGFTHPWGLGGGINFLNWGKIPRTTLSDKEGKNSGDFWIQDLLFNLSYGWKVAEDLQFGLSLKYVREKIDFVTARGLAIDFGGLYHPLKKNFVVGLVFQNIGPMLAYHTRRERLPLIFKAGIAYRALKDRLLFAVDFGQEKVNSYAFICNLGVEYAPIHFLKLRVGYNGRNQASTGLTLGIGTELKNFQVDYAFSPYGDLGNTHQISLTYVFSKGFLQKDKAKTDEIRTDLSQLKGIKIERKSVASSISEETKATSKKEILSITLPENVIHFSFDSTELAPDSFSALAKIAEILSNHPEYQVKIIGHTDSSGPAVYNQYFSRRRAESVLKYFLKAGLPSERFTTTGMGESKPTAPNTTRAGRSQNRRVEIILGK